MAIAQTKKQSDLEKRLKLLRHQVYGKPEFKLNNELINNYQPVANNISDITYFYKDLIKIVTFSAIAIGVEVVLAILLQNRILNFNF